MVRAPFAFLNSCINPLQHINFSSILKFLEMDLHDLRPPPPCFSGNLIQKHGNSNIANMVKSLYASMLQLLLKSTDEADRT